MDLTTSNDPRTSLQKYARKELEHVAQFMGWDDIEPGMPADVMRRRIQDKPDAGKIPPPLYNDINAPRSRVIPGYDQWLGLIGRKETPAQESVEVSAEAVLEAEWQSNKSYEEMNFTAIRAECKARGVKFSRKDKKETLIRMLRDGEDPTAGG